MTVSRGFTAARKKFTKIALSGNSPNMRPGRFWYRSSVAGGTEVAVGVHPGPQSVAVDPRRARDRADGAAGRAAGLTAISTMFWK